MASEPTKLAELAALVNGTLTGDPETLITGASTLNQAGQSDITLADKPELAKKLSESSAAAVVVSYSYVPDDRPTICVDDVHAAFTQIVTLFTPQRSFKTNQIHPSAIVDETASIGDDVTIHPRAVIGADVTIGDGVVIHSGAVVMDGTTIGTNTIIFPNVTLYENCVIGNDCIIHAGAVIGAYGFGYNSRSGEHILSSQLGQVVLEDRVEVGASSTIDRGTYGATHIGYGTKIDNLVMIGHNCEIGKHNLICALTGIAGSCTVGDYVVMAGQVGIGDHLEITDQVTLAAKSGVMSNITEKGVYVGMPISPFREQMRQWSSLRKLPALVKEMKALHRKVNETIEARAESEASANNEKPKQSAA